MFVLERDVLRQLVDKITCFEELKLEIQNIQISLQYTY